ncbi:hypothetical protein [Botrimarina mediterranea]|nr:hypothetical protein [Botrimarina mediterranea]
MSQCGGAGNAVREVAIRIGKTLAVMLGMLAVGLVAAVAFNYVSDWIVGAAFGREYRYSIEWVVRRAITGAIIFDAFLLASVYQTWWFAITELRRSIPLAIVVLILAIIYTMYAIAFGLAAVLFAPEGAVGRLESTVALRI